MSIEITEEMVDTACDAFDDIYDGVSHNKRDAIRECITAVAPLMQAKVAENGIKRAAAYIQHKADDYAAENCDMEPDTGATTYRYGRYGEEYHHTLLELAEEVAALPAAPEVQS